MVRRGVCRCSSCKYIFHIDPLRIEIRKTILPSKSRNVERVGNPAKSGIGNQQVVVILRVNETSCCNHCSRSSFSSTSVSIFHPLSPISCTKLTLFLSQLSTSAQPGSYLTISTSSQLPKVENERTNTAESSSNQRSR